MVSSNAPESLDQAAQHPLLSLLNPEQNHVLVSSAKRRDYRPKRRIFRDDQEPSVAFLLRGSARIFQAGEEGAELLVMLVKAPAILGDWFALTEPNNALSASTIQPATVLFVSATRFREHVGLSPAFAQAVAVDASERLVRATQSLYRASTWPLEKRVTELLFDYADLGAESHPQGIQLSVELTQNTLARDLGVSRRSVCRALDRLKEVGTLETRHRRYILRNSPRVGLDLTPTLARVHSMKVSAFSSSATVGGGGHTREQSFADD